MFYLKKKGGISLIEIVVIVAVITILVAGAIPAWRRYAPRLKLRQEADKIVDELKLSQQRTVSEQISYAVLFYTDTDSYEVVRFNPDPESPGEYIPETLSVKTLDPEIDLVQLYDFSSPQVRFTAAGGVLDIGQIELANAHGDIRTLDIRPSGFIEILD